MYKYLLIIVFLVLSNSIRAQKSIAILCRPMPDSIMLRWAPADARTWRLANEYGYQLRRYTILRDKKIPKHIEGEILTTASIKPARIDQWEPFIADKYVGIAAECVYSSHFKGIPTGGNPHLAYAKYKEEQQRYSFALFAADQSIKAAQLLGLYFADKTAKSNEKYLYQVYINCPDSLAKDTASVYTGISAFRSLPVPMDIKADWQDHKVNISWNIRFLKHIYNSYIVEKSIDNGKTFQQLGNNAIVQVSDVGVDPYLMTKSDSLPDNQTAVCYRVRGINAFGQKGPPSDSVFGMGRLPLAKAPFIVGNDVVNNEKVELKWDYPEEMNRYIEGFKLYRSSSPMGKKKLIYEGKQSDQRIYIDEQPDMTNYYRISVYDNIEEKISPVLTYAALIDSFPPMPPSEVQGAIDSAGVVTLNWRANSESDLNGYRVYRSNHPDYEFILVDPGVVKDTVFSDTINIKTLTRHIYYKVRAEDVRQNQSPFSVLIAIKRPDVIPPVSPLIKGITERDGKPELTWINSPSDDVVRHHIYRKSQHDSLFVSIVTLDEKGEVWAKYVDENTEPGCTYVYKIDAEDDSGQLSRASKTMQFKVASIMGEQLKLKRRVLADRIRLTWTIQSEKKVKRVVIYRAVNNEVLRLYDNTEKEEYFDTKLSPGKSYRYAIKAIYEDDSSSKLSEPISVRF